MSKNFRRLAAIASLSTMLALSAPAFAGVDRKSVV